MTLKYFCKCGKEFYIAVSEETSSNRDLVKSESKKFRDLHRACFTGDEKNLPEDWKL